MKTKIISLVNTVKLNVNSDVFGKNHDIPSKGIYRTTKTGNLSLSAQPTRDWN
jgi:hypothetical protein